MASPLPNPDDSDFVTWANCVGVSFNLLVPVASSEDLWKDWVCSLVPIRELGVVPNPMSFETWQEWAVYFINSLQQKP